jgi:hypothetical protein
MRRNPFGTGHIGTTAPLLRICQTALLALLLSACSRIQLAYNNLDWLLPHYLGSYMPLSDDQDGLLEARVENFLHWHCSTQVSGYAQLLREADNRFRSGSLTRTELESFNNRIQQAWTGILQQGGPAIAEILLTADDTQVRELFEGFDKRNKEWLEDFEDTSDEELREDYRERMGKELQRWFGKLNSGQEQVLVSWSRQFQPLGLEGLAVRQRWQSRLREIMDRRENPEAFQRDIAELMSNPGALRTPAYQQRINHNREATIDMLYSVIRQLSDVQKHHLQQQVNTVAGDFDKLTCSGEAVAAS